jgi:hypothetical protein
MWAGRRGDMGGVPLYPEFVESGELGMGDAPGVSARRSLLDGADADSAGCEFDMCRYEMKGVGGLT